MSMIDDAPVQWICDFGRRERRWPKKYPGGDIMRAGMASVMSAVRDGLLAPNDAGFRPTWAGLRSIDDPDVALAQQIADRVSRLHERVGDLLDVQELATVLEVEAAGLARVWPIACEAFGRGLPACDEHGFALRVQVGQAVGDDSPRDLLGCTLVSGEPGSQQPPHRTS